jgi:hypothetical protein
VGPHFRAACFSKTKKGSHRGHRERMPGFKAKDLARTENTENTEKISLDKKLKSEFAQRARRR